MIVEWLLLLAVVVLIMGWIALAGVLGVYALGVPWLWGVFHLHLGDPRTVRWAVVYGFLAPLGGDLVLCGLIALGAVRLRRLGVFR